MAYWAGRFAERFGNETAGQQLLEWYDVTGPVLPGLQNLTHVHNMNYFPTAVGKEQTVDAILNTAACTRDYPAQPVDTFFFNRYKQKYAMPELTDRITMPIDAYADKLAAGQDRRRRHDARQGCGSVGRDGRRRLPLSPSRSKRPPPSIKTEAARFVTDSQALVYVAQAWREKVYAAIAKRCYQDNKRREVRAGLAGSPPAISRNLRETSRPDRSDVRQRQRHGDDVSTGMRG